MGSDDLMTVHIIVIVSIIGSIFDIFIIIAGVRYNMSLRELAENKMIFDDELEQVLSYEVRFPNPGVGF